MNTCPYHPTRNPPREPLSHTTLGDEVRHMVMGIQTKTFFNTQNSTPREREYQEYAILLRDFIQQSMPDINEILEKTYIPGMELREFIRAIYTKFRYRFGVLANQTWDLRYGKLESGIGTMLVILTLLREKYPSLPQQSTVQHARIIMRQVFLHDIPNAKQVQDIMTEYEPFVDAYMSKKLSLNEDEAKLFCPAAYTREGNRFVEMVIATIYKHFPQRTEET